MQDLDGFEYGPGDVWWDGVDVILSNRSVVHWPQKFSIVRKASRREFNAEAVRGTCPWSHEPGAKYWEVATD